MNLEKLEKILSKEQKYRLKQAKSAVFKELIEDWEEAKSLPAVLRRELKENCPLGIKAQVFYEGSAAKVLITLKDGLKIESVLLRHKDGRNTVCVSSQVGCALRCQFCATGQLGLKRNLNFFEILEQVLFFARLLKKDPFDAAPTFAKASAGRQGKKITNIVFMGMGEPFLNYDNVLKAIRILNDKDGFNLGSRHFSISTCGIVEGIEKLSQEELQINLAVSLHAPDDELRAKLMPFSKKYPLKNLLEEVASYIEKTKRKVMFEYIMIKDVNDSDIYAQKLAQLVSKVPLSFVNLIACNPKGIFKPSLPQKIKRFKEVLEKEGVFVVQRHSFGSDIAAACGQLAAGG